MQDPVNLGSLSFAFFVFRPMSISRTAIEVFKMRVKRNAPGALRVCVCAREREGYRERKKRKRDGKREIRK